MRNRVAIRIGTFLAGIALASVIIFLVTNALPGDLARVILGMNATPEQVASLRAQLGYDQPLIVRYFNWIGGVLRADLGTSYRSQLPVTNQIAQRFAVTAWLTAFGMAFALLIAIPLGSFAAVYRRRVSGFVASAVGQVGLSIPAFWLGILLALYYAVYLRWLPATGYVPLSENPLEWARHLVLPVTTLALVQGSLLSRYVRSAVIDVLNEDYFRTARSIGWSLPGALWRHGRRNVAMSLVTVIGLQLAAVLVGAIVIEQVFALPGLGQLLLAAVAERDLILVQGIVLLLVTAVLLLNLLIDLAYLLIDPRLRSGGGQER